MEEQKAEKINSLIHRVYATDMQIKRATLGQEQPERSIANASHRYRPPQESKPWALQNMAPGIWTRHQDPRRVPAWNLYINPLRPAGGTHP